MSSPERRVFAPGRRPGGSRTCGPSTWTSSCMNTVSAPKGMRAPVKMRRAVPVASEVDVCSPATSRPSTTRIVGAEAVRSAYRTACPQLRRSRSRHRRADEKPSRQSDAATSFTRPDMRQPKDIVLYCLAMTIVTHAYRPKRAHKQKARAAAITGPAIVTARKPSDHPPTRSSAK